MTRREELEQIFKDCPEGQKILIGQLLDEVVFLEERMAELKKFPFVAVHPKNPQIQKSTAAAKQYKECSQSYMNAIRILNGILVTTEPSAADELMAKLAEFGNDIP